jgi:hypothetical protein
VNTRYTWDAIVPSVIARYEAVIARAGHSASDGS